MAEGSASTIGLITPSNHWRNQSLVSLARGDLYIPGIGDVALRVPSSPGQYEELCPRPLFFALNWLFAGEEDEFGNSKIALGPISG